MNRKLLDDKDLVVKSLDELYTKILEEIPLSQGTLKVSMQKFSPMFDWINEKLTSLERRASKIFNFSEHYARNLVEDDFYSADIKVDISYDKLSIKADMFEANYGVMENDSGSFSNELVIDISKLRSSIKK